MGGLRSWHIGKKLVSNGYVVDAIIPNVDSLSGRRKEVSKHKEPNIIDGVNVYWGGAANNNRNSLVLRVMYFLSSTFSQAFYALRLNRPDIVISTSIPLSSLVVSFLYAKIVGAKYIVDVRDTHIDSAIESGLIRKNIVVKTLMFIEGKIFKSADLNIAVTEGMADILIKKGVSGKKIEVIHLGFDGWNIYNGITDWSRNIVKELGLEGKKIALYSGTLGYVFDLDTIVNAAKILKNRSDIVFLFLGQGQRLEELKNTCDDAGVHSMFLGSCPKSDVPLYTKAADVALYAVKDTVSLRSIAGNKVFDYFGSGTPIVCACDSGDVASLILGANAGLVVKAGDHNAFASSITHLLGDECLTEKLGANGEKLATNIYSSENMMNKFLESMESRFIESKKV